MPSFPEGMGISIRGTCLLSTSSSVFGRCSSPGLVMTILKPPASDSLAMLDPPRMVESDRARRSWGRMLFRSLRRKDCSGWFGVEGPWLGGQ